MSTATDAGVRASAASDGPLLVVDDLVVEVRTERGWLTIVDGVSIDVRAGEFVGLAGESGSGKTMLALAVMGLLADNARIARGRIVLEGVDLVGLPPRAMNRVRGNAITMIFQEPRRCLNPAFTVGDQVAEVIRRHMDVSRREAWRRAVEMLELVEIPSAHRRANDYPYSFSGGMCQRVMLAMALACQPKLLIADEPTTALDVTVQKQMMALIASLQERAGMGVLLISHDLGVIAEMCDRMAVMYAGEVVEAGPVVDVLVTPCHPYSAGLVNCVPDPIRHADRLGAIAGVIPPPGQLPAGCRFHPRCKHSLTGTCTDQPIILRAVADRRLARCARTAELHLRGPE